MQQYAYRVTRERVQSIGGKTTWTQHKEAQVISRQRLGAILAHERSQPPEQRMDIKVQRVPITGEWEDWTPPNMPVPHDGVCRYDYYARKGETCPCPS